MKEQPIVLISGFKAGTWLMRTVLHEITNMDFFEPDIIPGERKYYDAQQLQFKENCFYSWHLVPTNLVIDKLNKNNAKTIFVVRNIYDLVISIYYHFYNDVDADIGRGNSKDSFLKKFSFEEGLSLIITGFDEGRVRWRGMVEVLEHYNEIFKASQACDSIVISYDELVDNKQKVLNDIVSFIGLTIESKRLQEIIQISAFSSMKQKAQEKEKGVSHFREGKASLNREKLSYVHKIQLRQMIKLLTPNIYLNAEKAHCVDIVNEGKQGA